MKKPGVGPGSGRWGEKERGPVGHVALGSGDTSVVKGMAKLCTIPSATWKLVDRGGQRSARLLLNAGDDEDDNFRGEQATRLRTRIGPRLVNKNNITVNKIT